MANEMMVRIASIPCIFHMREEKYIEKCFKDLWQANQGHTLTEDQTAYLTAGIESYLPRETDAKIKELLVQAVWYAYRPAEECHARKVAGGRCAIVNNALFFGRLHEGWKLVTENDKKYHCDFRYQDGIFIKQVKGKGVAATPAHAMERHVLAYDPKAHIPAEPRYGLHVYSVLLGLLPAGHDSKRVFHNAIMRLLLECHDLSDRGLADPCFYDARSLHKLIEHCRLVYLRAQEQAATTGCFAAASIVKTPLFQAMLYPTDTPAAEQAQLTQEPALADAVLQARQWASRQLPDHIEQLHKLMQSKEVSRWLCRGYYAHTLPAVLAMHGLGATHSDALAGCLDRSVIAHDGAQGQKARSDAPEGVAGTRRSGCIVYDVNGAVPDGKLSFYHLFMATLLGELPLDRWSFHNSMMALLMELNDTEHGHGLKDDLFFDAGRLEHSIDKCRATYIMINKGFMPVEALFRTTLFSAMVKGDIEDLDEGMRHFIDISPLGLGLKALAAQRQNSGQQARFLSLLAIETVMAWLRQATYVKTRPSILAYNYLAVKGLSDEQIESLAKKRIVLTAPWYEQFMQGRLPLVDVLKMMRALLHHAQLAALQLPAGAAYEVYALKAQTDRLFSSVAMMLQEAQLDPMATEALPPELDRIVASYLAFAKDELYASAAQRACCLLSLLSNLHTFLAKLQQRQPAPQAKLLTLSMVNIDGSRSR